MYCNTIQQPTPQIQQPTPRRTPLQIQLITQIQLIQLQIQLKFQLQNYLIIAMTIKP